MIIQGDCLEEMKKIEDNSIDFIVTDPPYALNFMGKDWDSEIPKIDIWKECLRICKSGSWMACFGGTRTFHRLTCLIEDAGWTIRDCLMYLYGSGFPKGKGCLKPAWEPIILARKDGPNPSLNIEECRILINQKDDIHKKNPHTKNKGANEIYGDFSGGIYKIPEGRWPANLILDEESGKMLDDMTGFSKSPSGLIKGTKSKGGILNRAEGSRLSNSGHGDSGGASRFFYTAKASTKERNEGLDKSSCHPTVKPLSLMRYIIKLLAPQGDPILLDPFCGSGSTCIAALQLGIKSIGIEKNEEYCEIARKRLEHHGQANIKNRQREQRCWQETFDFEEDGQEA